MTRYFLDRDHTVDRIHYVMKTVVENCTDEDLKPELDRLEDLLIAGVLNLPYFTSRKEFDVTDGVWR